jgi:leucyl aminopeptidase
MDVRGVSTPRLEWAGDCLVIGLFEEAELTGDLAELDQKLSGTLTELISETEFKGKPGSSAVTRVGGGSALRKVAVVGLGKAEDLKLDTLRRSVAAAIRIAKKEKAQTLGLSFPLWSPEGQADAANTAQALTEAVELTLHQDLRFKSESDDKAKLERVELLGLAGQEAAIAKAQQICVGVVLARELVSAPANVVTPPYLADTAAAIAQEHGLDLTVLEQADCEKLGMGAFLGVAKASDLPPKFIHLTYRPAGTPRKKVAIIGKGVTFDSGGLNIKPTGSGIEMMKTDMGGAAATLGAAKAIALLKPDVEVHFISAVTENMISGHALHPGDILTNNTDAEGRLTLADALVYTDQLGLDAMVDLATLTGACVIALGDDIAGMWTGNEAIASQMNQASERSGEKFWRMPIEDKYFDGLKSGVADMKNTGPRPGGAITATLFLKQFVKDTPWAHLDVAGPVWADKENGYNNAGATGFPVRTLVNWALG